jgi:hypothetical protein
MYRHFRGWLRDGKSRTITFMPVSMTFPQKANQRSDCLHGTRRTGLVDYRQLVQVAL